MLEVNIAGRTLFCLKRRGEEKMKKNVPSVCCTCAGIPDKENQFILEGKQVIEGSHCSCWDVCNNNSLVINLQGVETRSSITRRSRA